MTDELTYALITPYSLLKSRTGGIFARLLSLADLEFTGARMYAPSDAMVDRYCELIRGERMSSSVRDALVRYVQSTFKRNNRFGISNRAVLLLFRGPDAVHKMYDEVVGSVTPDVKGDTVRGTYGDLVVAADGTIEFFEPAVLTPTCQDTCRRQLALFSEFSQSDGGILTDVVQFPPDANVDTTLVILKPDNFARRSSRPGNIIDVFSRTGLFIVGARLMHMTVEEAEEFYGPLRAVFVEKLRGEVADRLRRVLGRAFSFQIPEESVELMADLLKEANAEHEFRKIVNYMTGKDVDAREGSAKCLALLYQGVDAISKIRDRLGATNPELAAEGTVRSTYGYDLMRNGAHASDSPESAERERKVVGLWKETGPCEVKQIIDASLRL